MAPAWQGRATRHFFLGLNRPGPGAFIFVQVFADKKLSSRRAFSPPSPAMIHCHPAGGPAGDGPLGKVFLDSGIRLFIVLSYRLTRETGLDPPQLARRDLRQSAPGRCR